MRFCPELQIRGQFRVGQSALTLAFLIGWITIIAGATLGFLASSFSTSALGFLAANRANAAASAGINDAILKLARTMNYTIPESGSYTFQTDGITTNVTIAHGVPSNNSVISTITAVANAGLFRRTIEASVLVDAKTGVRVLSRVNK